MKITKEYLRKLIKEEVEQIDEIFGLGGKKDAQGAYEGAYKILDDAFVKVEEAVEQICAAKKLGGTDIEADAHRAVGLAKVKVEQQLARKV